MPDKTGTHLRQVTWFWAILWLVAALVIGINATVVLHQYKVVAAEPTTRLAGMLLIGEVLLYFVVLMLPTERIVPPGRTVLMVIGAVGLRVFMAVISARMAILAGDTTAFDQLWRIMHSSFWLGALLQMALIATYLWLIRSALEVPRPRAGGHPRGYERPEQTEGVRTPARPSDEQIRQRQEQLLTALMENPDAPVETPISRDVPGTPLPGVSAEPEPDAAPTEDQVPEFLRIPTASADQPSTAAADPPAQMEMDLAAPKAPDAADLPSERTLDEDQEAGQATDSLPPVPGTAFTATAAPSEAADPPTDAEHREAAALMEPTQDATYPSEAPHPVGAKEATEATAETPAEAMTEPPERITADMPTEAPVRPHEPPAATEPVAAAEPPTEPETPVEAPTEPSPEQDFVLRNALNRVVPGQTVETALSAHGRIYALVGLSPEVAADSLTEALDKLLASAQSAAAAVRAGCAQTVLLMAQQATLVTATSADRNSQIVIQSAADTKLGQLILLGRRAAQVAADVRLGNHCLQPETELQELARDPSWAAPTPGQLSQPLAAFGGTDVIVLTTAAGADAPAIAGAAEGAYRASVAVAEALQLGAVDRVLIEGSGAGLVIGPAGTDDDLLLAVPAESTAKMGAANVTLTKLRDALRGEA